MPDLKKKLYVTLFASIFVLGGVALWFVKNMTFYDQEIATVDAPTVLIERVRNRALDSEPKIEITTSTATIGTREFKVTATGDFDHFACSAIKETIYALPADKDIIVTARRDNPFDVFRLDLLAETLRSQNLPFIVWEDVPVEDRPRAHFSTISTLAWGKTTNNKFAAIPLLRDRRVMEMIDFERTVSLYPDFGIGSKSAPVRKYKLTDVHSLIEIQGYYGLAHYDETLFQDWTKGYSPFVGGASVIQGPFVTLRHPPENTSLEVAIASNLLDQQQGVLEIFRDDRFLYTVTIEDKIQWSKHASIKVTRFDPSQFAYVVIEGDKAFLSHKKSGKAPQGEAIELCELTLKLQ